MRARGLNQKVVALCDGTRTAAEIADALGVVVQYVNATIRRKNLHDKVVRGRRRRPEPKGIDHYLVALMGRETGFAVQDRADALRIDVAQICQVLLRVAVEVGDLDTHFPVDTP